MHQLIRRNRLLARLTKEMLAKKAQIDINFYTNIENGKITGPIPFISNIAEVLNISPEELEGRVAPYEFSSENDYFGEIVLHFLSGMHLIAPVTHAEKISS